MRCHERIAGNCRFHGTPPPRPFGHSKLHRVRIVPVSLPLRQSFDVPAATPARKGIFGAVLRGRLGQWAAGGRGRRQGRAARSLDFQTHNTGTSGSYPWPSCGFRPETRTSCCPGCLKVCSCGLENRWPAGFGKRTHYRRPGQKKGHLATSVERVVSAVKSRFG